MDLNFAQVSKNEGIEQEFSFNYDCVGMIMEFNREELKICTPLIVTGKMISYEEKINVSLDITTEVERICSRCLENYQEKLVIENSFVFVNQYYKDEEEEYITYSNDSYDMTELVMDEVASQIAMKPLCSESCKGLCPVCGMNKNNTDCRCKLDNIDPRLQILSSLLNQK